MKNIISNSSFFSRFCKNTSKLFLGFLIIIMFFGLSSHASASITPTLSVYGTGNGDSVQVNVTGDPNSSVILYYSSTTGGQQFYSLGSTDASGNFSTNVSSSSYGIASGSPVHVTLNGINGIPSATVMWPIVTSVNTSQMTLSQNGLILGVGQSNIVTVTNSPGSLFISTNTNPSVANANISGTSLTINASAIGSTLITVCPTGTTSGCPSVSVVVQNSGAQTLIFSQNNITLSSGQNTPITVSGGNGYYNIINNSNPSFVQASVNASTINLSTTATAGSAAVTVCSTDMSACGIINISISGTSSALTFNQTNPTLSIGQSLGVVVYGSSGTYYISSNSSPSVVQANISSNVLTIYGIATGSSIISVCASSGGCSQLSVIVSYSSTNSGSSVILSQTSLNLTPNQSSVVTVTGGTAPYVLPVSSGGIFQASIIGNTLTVTGLYAGSTQISVCSSNGGCSLLYLTVSGGTSTNGSQISLSQSTVSLTAGQNTTVSVYGNGSYYLASNSNPSVANATLSGSNVTISGISYGTTNLSICQSGGQCISIYVTVTTSNTSTTGGTSFLNISQSNPTMLAGQTSTVSVSGGSGSLYNVAYNSNSTIALASVSGNTLSIAGLKNGYAVIVVCDSVNDCAPVSVIVGVTSAPVTTPIVSSGSVPTPTTTYQFNTNLSYGMTGTDVSELQKRLTSEGVYTGPINGRFGPLTEAAVKEYQTIHKLSPVGEVGILTRTLLNYQTS